VDQFEMMHGRQSGVESTQVEVLVSKGMRLQIGLATVQTVTRVLEDHQGTLGMEMELGIQDQREIKA
jgi:hypothetical protein